MNPKSSTLYAIFVLFSSFPVAFTSPYANSKRDGHSVHITSPDRQTFWMIGQSAEVKWDTTGLPPNAAKERPEVLLKKGGVFVDGDGGLGKPLASGFNLLDGVVEFKVPSIQPGLDYAVVLFGDSGDSSPPFEIGDVFIS